MLLPIFMTATLLVVIFYRRKQRSRKNLNFNSRAWHACKPSSSPSFDFIRAYMFLEDFFTILLKITIIKLGIAA